VPTQIIMPALGMAQDTGKVLRWLAAEGQPVVKGQPLMEIETDKVTVEIEAPASGVLAGVRAQVGQDIPVGQVVAFILAQGESLPAEATLIAPVPPAHPAATHIAPVSPTPPRTGERPPASPKARRLAQERGVDLSRLTGSGPGGEITSADVTGASPIAVSGAWRTMAERLARAWSSVPHFYLTRDVDAQRLIEWRRRLHAVVPAVTYTDLVVALTARALRTHPRLAARWEDGRLAGEIQIGIGIAVATADGLIVPVILRPDERAVEDIARVRHDLVTRAHAGRLRPEDVRGGTFTISNLGMFGVDAVAAMVNPPQAAILGVGRIADRVVAISGSPAVRPVLTLTLTCDHRVVDGARAAEFLVTLADLIEAAGERAS